MDESNNFTYLTNGFYIVRTQAGFRQALKHYAPSLANENPSNWPSTFPSIVALSTGYAGYHFINVNVMHVNKMKDFIKDV